MQDATQKPPTAAIDYEELRQATIEAGKFAPPADATWFLTGQIDKDGPIRYVPINVSPFRVGRRGDLSLCLPCMTVSGLHAEIFQRDEEIYVRDLKSTNGTFVNGAPVRNEMLLREGDLVQFANIALRVNRQVNDRGAVTAVENVCDQALALTRFDDLMSEKAVVPYYQPIVALVDTTTVGYEVLGRSRLFGLRSPREMFHAAARLNLETELSRLLRSEGIRTGQQLSGNLPLWVNTHPVELKDVPQLIESLRATRQANPNQPITLEIHEAAITSATQMCELRAALNDLDMKLAYDDFGAGQARFIELSEMPPDVLKFDMGLVQGIHAGTPQRQQVLASLTRMTRDLGVTTLAEGVECEEEAETCRQLGFELAQGYFFGKPASAMRYAN